MEIGYVKRHVPAALRAGSMVGRADLGGWQARRPVCSLHGLGTGTLCRTAGHGQWRCNQAQHQGGAWEQTGAAAAACLYWHWPVAPLLSPPPGQLRTGPQGLHRSSVSNNHMPSQHSRMSCLSTRRQRAGSQLPVPRTHMKIARLCSAILIQSCVRYLYIELSRM